MKISNIVKSVVYAVEDKANKKYLSDNEALNRKVMKINIKNAKELGTDLLEADWFNGCCPMCQIYSGRVFSISGKDKRFPKLPKKYNCTCAGISFSPFLYGISTPLYCPKDTDIITYSNRPFE